MPTLDSLPTPSLLVDRVRLAANIGRMQQHCRKYGVELRPHIKTHKLVQVARQQLAAGAAGLTCAKIGEAEAMLPSGVRSLFLAHSLVDLRQAPRLAALAAQLDDLRVGLTSEQHLAPLGRLAAATGRRLAVMMAMDSGLGREGVRDQASAQRLARALDRHPHLTLAGFYTHEGHFYGVPPAEIAARSEALIAQLASLRDSIDPALPIWPGCSVSAQAIAAASAGRVQAVRPGSYVFGDLSLTKTTDVMAFDAVALHVLATVVDKPAPGFALIDAGSKTFSSDRSAAGFSAIAADGRAIFVERCNEEHGYVRGADVDALQIGERLILTPAHVCTVINLADQIIVTDGDQVVDTWRIDARGKTQ